MPEIEVIVPTFREAGNLPALLQRLLATFDRAKLDAAVLLVDDDSQDGTEEAVAAFRDGGRVRLFVRKGERGLATAVLEGFRRSQARILVVCDADLSHPVEAIPDLVAPLRSGEAEMTIGSRFVPGGEDSGRGWLRRLASRVACWAARPLVAAKDPVSGFFAVSREAVERQPLDPLGFKIALEILVRCRVTRLREIPIRFVDRVAGQSKLGLREIAAYLRHLLRLADFQKPGRAQMLRFACVGAMGFALDSMLFFAGYQLAGLHYQTAQAISFAGTATHNFLWHRHWTFPVGRRSRPMLQYAVFLVVAIVALALRSLAMAWLVESMGWHPYPALILGILLVVAINFLGSRHLVFQSAPQ